ncbi:putative DNA-binding protein [Ligilactobacillus sp. LYQ135]
MEIAKTNRINSLFEFYEPLLTKKQMEYLAQYYRDDYSLGEIAENYNVSRQAVYDNIKRTEKILEEYEDKLHLYANFQRNATNIDALLNYVQENYPNDQKLIELAHKLESIEE